MQIRIRTKSVDPLMLRSIFRRAPAAIAARPHMGEANHLDPKQVPWAATRLYAGCLLPLSKHVELDPHYQHENNSGPRPNQQKNGAGLILWLYLGDVAAHTPCPIGTETVLWVAIKGAASAPSVNCYHVFWTYDVPS